MYDVDLPGAGSLDELEELFEIGVIGVGDQLLGAGAVAGVVESGPAAHVCHAIILAGRFENIAERLRRNQRMIARNAFLVLPPTAKRVPSGFIGAEKARDR